MRPELPICGLKLNGGPPIALCSKRMQLERIQEALRRERVDGWLFFDHHVRDLWPIAY